MVVGGFRSFHVLVTTAEIYTYALLLIRRGKVMT